VSPGDCPILVTRLYRAPEPAKGLCDCEFALSAAAEFPVSAGYSAVALRSDESQADDPDADM
jgi:hypothetical protein